MGFVNVGFDDVGFSHSDPDGVDDIFGDAQA